MNDTYAYIMHDRETHILDLRINKTQLLIVIMSLPTNGIIKKN